MPTKPEYIRTDRYGRPCYRLNISLGKKCDGTRARVRPIWKGRADKSRAWNDKQAAVELQRLNIACLEGRVGPSSGMTLTQWAEVWLAEHGTQLAESTRRKYRLMLETQILPDLGKGILEKIQPRHVQTWVYGLAKPGRVSERKCKDPEARAKMTLSPATQATAYRALHTCLQAAVARGLIYSNPAAAVKPPRAPRQDARHLRQDALQRVFAALAGEPPMLRALVTLAITTGMRLGEIAALRWEDVDIAGKTIHVRASVELATGKKQEEKETKTATAIRPVGMPDRLVVEMTAWKAAQGGVGDGHVFTTEKGRWIRKDSLSHRWYRFFTRKNLPAVNFHGLRHTAASLMLSSGVDVRTVSAVLGHAQPSTTLNIYGHMMTAASDRAAAAIDAALSQKMSQNDENHAQHEEEHKPS